MAKASALLVGLKSVDPDAYGGWDGTGGCWGCELDVDNIERILKAFNYQIKILKTAQATRDAILASLYRAAENTTAGDLFVFYYSGHGGQQPDVNGDELDGKDETLVAYDREVIDDKVHQALERFSPGVRIVMITDSCNSGTNYRARMTVKAREDSIFRPIARKSARNEGDSIKAQLIHIGGCRDGFTSAGYMGGGAFTMALCQAWNNGAFTGTYKELHQKICETINSSQKPQYTEYGPVSDEFKNGRAFELPSTPPVPGYVELNVIDQSVTQGEISRAGQKLQYRFTADKTASYTIETEGRTDLVLTLYGPDTEDKVVATDDDSGAGLNAKITTDLSAGTYYVRVQHYDAERGTGSFSIKVTKS